MKQNALNRLAIKTRRFFISLLIISGPVGLLALVFSVNAVILQYGIGVGAFVAAIFAVVALGIAALRDCQ